MVAVVLVLVAVAVVVSIVFLRAVFGGSTFRRERRRSGEGDDGRGPRADHHAGNGTWPGGGGMGGFRTWSSGG